MMTRYVMIVSVLISAGVMCLIQYFIVKKFGFKTTILGVICMNFTVLPAVIGIAGISRLDAGTYVALIIIFIVGLFLIKPGFRKIENSTH